MINEVIKKLELSNVNAVHGRAEETAKEQAYREKFDIVISRAVARLNVLMELTSAFVRVGGKCIYMKADKTDEEISEAKKASIEMKIQKTNIYEYNLSLGEECFKRTIIEYNKTLPFGII